VLVVCGDKSMLAQLTVRARLLLLAVVPLLVLIGMALSNASRLNQSFEELFADRMQPISQLKLISDAYAVVMVDALHKYRPGIFGETRLRKEFGCARRASGGQLFGLLQFQQNALAVLHVASAGFGKPQGAEALLQHRGAWVALGAAYPSTWLRQGGCSLRSRPAALSFPGTCPQ
jgi:hypothetical protein